MRIQTYISPIQSNPHYTSKNLRQSFTSYNFPLPQYSTSNQIKPAVNSPSVPEWIKDETIFKAVNELKDLEFSSADIAYVQSLGALPPFKSGKDAVDFINNSNTRIKFEALPSPNVHAQYDYENNFIKINEIYKNTQNPAEILAISEAILHEAGHSYDHDEDNSVQEEINCLSLNAISHRAFSKKYPNIFSSSDALIIKDGVCVYGDLFFDSDPEKKRLEARLHNKYSFLPAGDFVHPPSALAIKVKNQ